MSDDKLRLGGMALRNGLLVHGPTHWAAAVRTKDGEVKVASGRKPTFGGTFDRVPGLRGVARLGEAFAVIPLVKRALPEAKLPMQDVRTLGAMAGAAAAGRALRRSGPRTLARETGVALISLAPALLALRQGELASWHGVEHKAIAAYEQDGETADASKEHDRCGSNLVAPMLAATAAGSVAVRKAGLQGPGRRGRGRAGQPGGRRRGLRLVRAALPTPRSPRRSGAPATRFSGWWARASRARPRSRSDRPRWRRSCAARRTRPRVATPFSVRLDVCSSRFWPWSPTMIP